MNSQGRRRHRRLKGLVQLGLNAAAAVRANQAQVKAKAEEVERLRLLKQEQESELEQASMTMEQANLMIDQLRQEVRRLEQREHEAIMRAREQAREHQEQAAIWRVQAKAMLDDLNRERLALHDAKQAIAQLEKRLADDDTTPKLRRRLARKTEEIAEHQRVIRKLQMMLAQHGQMVVFQEPKQVVDPPL